MPMDIRSFFPTVSKKTGTHKPEENPKEEKTKKPSKKPKSSNSSIEDVIPETPDVKKTKKSQKTEKTETKRKRIVVASDSDSDVEIAKPKSKTAKIETLKEKNGKNKKIEVISDSDSDDSQAKLKVVKKVEIMIKEKKKEPEKPKKIVNAFDAFGDEPVKQTKVEKPKPKTELNIHDDDDFEKTLMELDESEIINETPSKSKPERHVNLEKSEGEKTKSPEKKSSITKTANDTLIKSKSKTPEKIKTPSRSTDSSKKRAKSKTPERKLSSSHSNDSPASNKKRKVKAEEDEDDGTNKDLERYEKKQYSAMLYQKYLHRAGPAHLGSKWIPKGKENCLKDLTFVITGVLDSLGREDAENLIVEHGGKCMKALSGKTKFLIVGDDAGPSKLEKANKFGTKILNEGELIDLICVKSGIENKNKIQEKTKTELIEKKVSPKKIKEEVETKSLSRKLSQKLKNEESIKKESVKTKKEVISDDDDDDIPSVTVKSESSSQIKTNNFYGSKSEVKKVESKPSSSTIMPKIEKKEKVEDQDQLSWVDKYRPKDMKQIIGQQQDGSNAKKLMNWLQKWYKNHDGKTKLVKPSPWAKNDDGAYFKAALLSGPPGVGKTTTANVVAKELGFDVVEFNASDTRSKKLLHEEVAQLIKTRSLAGYFQDGSAPSNKHVLLMDEVDGMSGNEDRGGMQELIDLIKKSSIPIICMCNDRQHPKVRSLANYCYDLRFGKPRLEQIRGAMMSICFKEGIDISTEALTDIIVGSGMDIRQILNNLSMWSAKDQTVSKEDTKKDAAKAIKDVKLGPWDVIRKVFSEEDHKKMSIDDKYGLFFYDYSINPLFVQENYLQVKPNCPSKEVLSRVAYAADSISLGDLVDSKIRSSQSWGLLDSQALFSSVIPGSCMEGHMAGQINFPGWLGKNSKANKFKRMLGELQSHMRTTISGCRQAVNLDYLSHIYRSIVTPLVNEGMDGIPKAISVMQEYHLMREDLTNLSELVQWPKSKDIFKNVEPKVKAAFTRAYNKDIMLPYAVEASAVKKRRGAGDEEEIYGEEEEGDDDDEEEEDNIENNPMIKVKKPSTKATKTSEKTTAKEKGKAPAKPRAKRGK